MPTIKVTWEWFEFKPPCVWYTVKKRALERTELKLSTIERCVYVVRFSHTYCVEYRLRASPVLYIGCGQFQQRITSHLYRINELAEKLRDIEIQVWFFSPRVQRTPAAYKTVEADLIEEFVKEMGSVPWFNSNRPKRKYKYLYDPKITFRQALLQGRGAHYPWSLRPNVGNEMKDVFSTGFEAEPRD